MFRKSEATRHYESPQKLAYRALLQEKYTVAEEGWFEWVAARLPLERGATILDIGCGPGWFWTEAVHILPPNIGLTLLDTSKGMVDDAVANCRSLPFESVTGRVANAVELPFADDSFDAVLAMHMLYHVHDKEGALAEMRRVLKPGGVLAVTTNGIDNLRELYELAGIFGGAPVDPAAALFDFREADRLMRDEFGFVEMKQHPARLRITDREDVVHAFTSYPPGEDATDEQVDAFRAALDEAFARGGGVLDVAKETGLFLSRKLVSKQWTPSVTAHVGTRREMRADQTARVEPNER